MSQTGSNRLPVAKTVTMPDKHTTVFTTKKGEFIPLPTEEQAKKKASEFLKKFKPEEWWAQKVSRRRQGKTEYLIAYIIRDFSKNHDRSDLAEYSQDQMWFGRTEIGVPSMITDENRHSDTYGERIPETIPMYMQDGTISEFPVLQKRSYYNYMEVNTKNVELFKKMCGMTMDDRETEFVFVIQNGGRNVSADDPDDIWDMTTEAMKLEDRMLKKSKRKRELAGLKSPEATSKLV